MIPKLFTAFFLFFDIPGSVFNDIKSKAFVNKNHCIILQNRCKILIFAGGRIS